MPGEVHLQQLLDIGGDMHRLDRGQAQAALLALERFLA
jgi:hypothetical protein